MGGKMTLKEAYKLGVMRTIRVYGPVLGRPQEISDEADNYVEKFWLQDKKLGQQGLEWNN